ncbi:type II toxin-antitoxin system RelE/ParE family toxin [Leptolyngbya sp. GGD]|uniref:type II toxin-antitoxin system RelE/ParE family toxin n=1 Tax=Leptolyngbya sp. GGD TaxID=2997907 RepID=UPI00227A8850|nr:type II toxin-antitoxin system RelE/ParE family toxin [Leptolyngbya sp. GGD]MCY6490708.1 type II toxin-antitoxin system RelE/ParE family toxin [Leptolyngbya sp. GGD]
MTRRYQIAPAASRDLNRILDYFLERSIDASEKFVDEFERKCRNIVSFPNIGKSYGYLAPNLRGVLLNDYIVLYIVTDELVEVVSILHGRQDLEAQFPESWQE